MSASVKSEKWTETSILQSSLYLGAAGVAVLIFAVLKLRPYFDHSPIVKIYNGGSDQTKKKEIGTGKKEVRSSWLDSLPGSHRARDAGLGQIKSGGVSTSVKVIERPLFDGLTVTVRATLTRGISSLEPDTSVEAVYESLIRSDDTRELDDRQIQGAKLNGLAVPNLDLKRMVLHFSELVTVDGRSYAIQAAAIDPETQTQGVPAHYSSGLATRLTGVGLSRVITVGDQILMAKILPDPSGATIAQQTSIQAVNQMNNQAANDLSLEATRDLRETKAELTLAAGTVLTLRLRVLPEQQKGGGK